MKKTLVLVLTWIVLINFFGLIAWNRWNVNKDTAYNWIDPKHLHAPTWNVTKLPARWDSEWYNGLAKNGYQFRDVNSFSNIVFFPVYPLLMHALGTVTNDDEKLAGWLISLASLIGAALIFYKLVKEFHPKLDALEPLWFLLIFPTAIFFNAVYTESIFLFLSLSTIYLARKKMFGFAALVGAVAALTRVTGVLLFLPLVWEYLATHKGKNALHPRGLTLLLIPLAAFSFFLYHKIAFGSFWLFFRIETVWGRSLLTLNREHFFRGTHAAEANLLLDAGFVLLAIALIIIAWKKIRPSYAIYATASLLVPLSTGSLMSIGRYILVLFPLHMALATLPPAWKRGWTLLSILLLGLYATLFAHSYWAG
ncbi:MAG: hypothetical protein Q7N87_02835 [Candidatus Uhrbacteria bacterium]|nr:hypothetical protein [Candidatus Uhrbacteria bacterium]